MNNIERNFAIVEEANKNITITVFRDSRKIIKEGFESMQEAITYCRNNNINFKG